MARTAVALTLPRKLGGRRLDEALAQLVPGYSRSQLQKLVRRGGLTVDGRVVARSNGRVRGGEAVTLELESPQPFGVLHEDDHVAVVDKPAGLVTHANEKIESGALADLLVQHYGDLPVGTGEDRPGIVHRLDRETSGVLVVARTDEAMDDLREQFRARTVEKTYVALVHGSPADDAFEVDRELAPEEGVRDRWRVVEGGGKPSRTRFEVAERFDGFAWIRCYPETGRRHQIRLHLLDAGLPIVADKLYGRKDVRALPPEAPRPRRQALHAQRLAFAHPATGERRGFEAKLAPDLAPILAWLRRG